MILFISGFVAAIVIIAVFLWAAGRERPSTSLRDKIVNPGQIAKRRENLEKVMQMAREKGEIKNDDVQYELGVSDATATRYFEELEREGKLVQSGSGKGIIYRIK